MQSRMLCAIALLALIGFSMAACGDGSGGGSGAGQPSNGPESIRFYGNNAGYYLTIWFDTWGTVWWNGSSDDLNREFTLSIDGNTVKILKCSSAGAGIALRITEYPYEDGRTYKIKVVYKASSANFLYVDFMDKQIPVKSFTIENNVIFDGRYAPKIIHVSKT